LNGTQLGCHRKDLFPYCAHLSSNFASTSQKNFREKLGTHSLALGAITRLLCVVTYVAMLILPSIANAATFYWVGTAGGNTSNPNNWAIADPTACTGGGGFGVPTATDTVVFDADCDNAATVNQTLDVAGLMVQAGYAGTVTQNQTVTVGNQAFTMAGGSWTSGANTVTVNGNLILSGGTFTAPSTTLSVSGNFTNSGGTFNAALGTVSLNGTNQTITGSNTFYTLSKSTTTACTLTFESGSTTTVTNSLSKAPPDNFSAYDHPLPLSGR